MDYRVIRLKNGMKLTIDFDSRKKICYRCGKNIRLGFSSRGIFFPVSRRGGAWKLHFSECKYSLNLKKTSRLAMIDLENKNQEELNNL